MAYYSFYKIIKDIIKTIFGRKFSKFTLLIIIAFIVFLVLSDKGVFAVDFSYNNYTFHFSDNMENYDYIFTVYDYSSTKVQFAGYFFPKNSNVKISINNNTHFFTFLCDKYYYLSGSYTQTELNNMQFGSWITDNNFTNGTTGGSLTDTSLTARNKVVLNPLGGNFDLYDTDGNLFYSPFPAVSNPSFFNKDTFINFTSDSLVIHPNDYGVEDTLYLHFLTVDSTVSDDVNTYYYYSESVFALNNNSKYYDILDDTRYYNIPRYIFGLQANKQYVFFLSDSSDPVNNSVGLYDFSDDYDGFYLNPTSSQITPDDTIINNQQNQNNQLNDINNFLNDKNIDSSTNNDINNSLNKDVSTNSDAIVTSFFSTLTNMISDVADYELSEDTTISLPVMNTDQNIVLHSNYLYTYLNPAMKAIIYAFWYYIFGFYIFKFVNKIYISVKSGNILNGVSSSGEVITNDML